MTTEPGNFPTPAMVKLKEDVLSRLNLGAAPDDCDEDLVLIDQIVAYLCIVEELDAQYLTSESEPILDIAMYIYGWEIEKHLDR